jgi:hypothetical protein
MPPALVIFLYINNEYAEKDIRKTVPFTIASINKIPKNKPKGVKDFYNENYKSLKKEMKDT